MTHEKKAGRLLDLCGNMQLQLYAQVYFFTFWVTGKGKVSKTLLI